MSFSVTEITWLGKSDRMIGKDFYFRMEKMLENQAIDFSMTEFMTGSMPVMPYSVLYINLHFTLT